MWLHIRSAAHTDLTNTSQASLLTVKLLEELVKVKVHPNFSAIFHSFVSKKTSRKKQRRELKAKKKKKRRKDTETTEKDNERHRKRGGKNKKNTDGNTETKPVPSIPDRIKDGEQTKSPRILLCSTEPL